MTVDNTAPTAATPAASPPGGIYASDQTVTLTCATSGATIYYTTDDSDPTTSPTKQTYSGAITVPMGTTLKAYAEKAGMSDSAVLTEVYTPTGENRGGGCDTGLGAAGIIVLLMGLHAALGRKNREGLRTESKKR